MTAVTGPDTQRAQAHNHTQNSNSRTHPRQTSHSHAHTHLPNGERCPSTDDTAPHHSHSHSATPTRGIRKPPCSEFPHNVTTPLSTTPKWPPHTTYTPGHARCCIKTVITRQFVLHRSSPRETRHGNRTAPSSLDGVVPSPPRRRQQADGCTGRHCRCGEQ